MPGRIGPIRFWQRNIYDYYGQKQAGLVERPIVERPILERLL
jgi:hypothetical protein